MHGEEKSRHTQGPLVGTCWSRTALGKACSDLPPVQVVLSNSVISKELGDLVWPRLCSAQASKGMLQQTRLELLRMELQLGSMDIPEVKQTDCTRGIDGVPAGFLVTAVQQVVAFFVFRAETASGFGERERGVAGLASKDRI